MLVRFTKMHGLGNDFVVIDAVTQRILINSKQVRRLADRHLGIGCDQLLLVEPPISPDADFYYRIFNANGSEVAQCGNGARCFGRFVIDNLLFKGDNVKVDTMSGRLHINVQDTQNISVNMGAPILNPKDIPFNSSFQAKQYEVKTKSGPITLAAVSMGNPHAVIEVEDITTAPVERLGSELATHPDFPEGVNVGFVQHIARDQIKLRVYERGVGETQACGSGACAAVVAGQLQQTLDQRVNVELPGGSLTVTRDEDDAIWLQGPVTTVYQGRFVI